MKTVWMMVALLTAGLSAEARLMLSCTETGYVGRSPIEIEIHGDKGLLTAILTRRDKERSGVTFPVTSVSTEGQFRSLSFGDHVLTFSQERGVLASSAPNGNREGNSFEVSCTGTEEFYEGPPDRQ